ncbi:MAG: hypothetical protein AB7D51_15140, partial [Desulfovibrionaceae bacterium]
MAPELAPRQVAELAPELAPRLVAELDIRISVKGAGPGRTLLEAEGLLPIPEDGGFRAGDEVEVWLL